MNMRRLSNVIGFDDAPFPRDYVGRVKVVGTVFAGLRLDGVLVGEVEKDGMDAAFQLLHLIRGSRFRGHPQLIMLQGIALAGFNVVDVFFLHHELGLPILVVSRRLPNMEAVREALLNGKIPSGRKKWTIIEQLGPMEPVHHVHVQRVGLSRHQAERAIKHFAGHSHIPEPLRAAHLIAGAIAEGQSRGDP